MFARKIAADLMRPDIIAYEHSELLVYTNLNNFTHEMAAIPTKKVPISTLPNSSSKNKRQITDQSDSIINQHQFQLEKLVYPKGGF